jgi:serine/threonine protein kinase
MMTNEEMQVVELPANFLEIISGQNHYMRLGLRTNAVEAQDIQVAWETKREAFEQARLENVISLPQFEQGIALLREAYDTLSDSDQRKAYDRRLFKAFRKSSTNGSLSPADPFSTRYSIESLVHEGRRAKVWAAQDQRISRKVLIKELHPSVVRTEDQMRCFREECGFYASSNATHLVKVLDYDEKSFRVVIEWLPDNIGDASLRRWEEGRDFGPNEIREFLRQCLRGLQVLHSRGWVHGRLSPSHLLLDDHGNIKLSITPGMRESSIATAPTSDIIHIAPEMLRPDVFGPVTPASDLYVLGFIALDLITRNKIVEQVDPASEEQSSDQERWYRWHASPVDTLPSTADWMHDVPEDILSFLGTLTNKQPAQRPSDASEALSMLEELSSTFSSKTSGADSSDAHPYMLPEDYESEHLGSPPVLHDAQYEDSNMTTWQAFKQASRDWLGANPQRKWLVIGSVAAGLLLMFSITATTPIEIEKQDVASEPTLGSIPSLPPSEDDWDAFESDEEDSTSDSNKASENPVESKVVKQDSITIPPSPPLSPIPNPPMPTPVEVVDDTKPKWKRRSFRADIPFGFVGVSDKDYQREVTIRKGFETCIDYLNHGGRDPQYKLEAWDYKRNRDPRISLLLAVYAYRKGKLVEAEKLCEESIAVTEANAVPFVLPYQLLIEIKESRQKSVRESLAILSNSIISLAERSKRTDAEEAKRLIAEQLWVFGNIVKHAEEKTGKQAGNLMDASKYVEVILLNDEHADSPFEQGQAEYEARMASTNPRWHAQALEERARVARQLKSSGEYETFGDGSGEYASPGEVNHLSGETDSDSSMNRHASAAVGPRRPLRDQLNRRALSMDPDLGSLVLRVKLTLLEVPKNQLASR